VVSWKSRPSGYQVFWLTAIALAVLAAPRVVQWHGWTSNPEMAFSGDVVVASTDSYHLFRAAREMQNGSWDPALPDRSRAFPDGAKRSRIALFPALMAWVGDVFGTSVYRAGMMLALVFAVAFALPMVLFFARCGVPLVGFVGAAIGGLNSAYFHRTSVYRVDTDGGNLFFCWLATWALLGASQARGARRQVGWSAATGLASAGLALWYAQPGFLWVFGGGMALCCLVDRTEVRAALRMLAVFTLFAGPSAFAVGAADGLAFVRGYLVGSAGGAAEAFPNVLDEIHELQRLAVPEALGWLQRPWPLGALGLLGFGWLMLRLGRDAFSLLPLSALGMLGLVHSQRFLMYLGPLAAAGLGAWLVFALGSRVKRPALRVAASVALVALLLPGTAAFDTPRPRMTVATLSGLQRVGEAAPRGAVALAPWNEGYPLMDVARLATFGDGQEPDPVVEYLIALAFVSPEPAGLRAVSNYLATHSRAELYAVLEARGPQGLIAELVANARPSPVPEVVVFTRKILQGFSHLVRKASWDFEARAGKRGGYDVRECIPLQGLSYRCSKDQRADYVLDMEEGSLNGRPVAVRSIRVRAGEVVVEHDFERRGVTLQLVEAARPPHTLHILDEPVFRSNFNQMFVLGRYDASLFEPLVASLPEVRAYLQIPQAR
jgi:dolichyl-diphosphooligosaccharide--protein glycosyltransferase